MANYTQYIPQVNSTTYPVSISNCFTALTTDITALEDNKLNLSGGILTGNLGIGGASFSSSTYAIFLANDSAPSGTPSGGGLIFVEAGALKYKGSSGTVTVLGVA